MEPKDINFAAMPQTAVNVITKPSEFFQGMPKTGGFLEPLVFVIVMGVITGIIQAIIHLSGIGHGAGYRNGMRASFSIILLMPIAVAVVSFIGAAILFVIWKLMGSQENYETAYRCSAYLTALVPITTIVGAVPYAGGIIKMAIYVFYLVMASVHVHNLPSQKSWLVFGIIGAIFTIMAISSEYRIRHASSEMDKWLKMGKDMRKEYQGKAKEMGKSADESRKQTEKMASQFQKQAKQNQ